MLVEAEIDAVGIDKIGQRLAVTFELVLVGVLHGARMNIEADILGLAMPDGDQPALENKIRPADLDRLRFVQCRDIGGYGVEKPFQRRAVR